MKNMRTKHRGKSIRKLASVQEQWMVITPLAARGAPCTAKIILDWSPTLQGSANLGTNVCSVLRLCCLHIPPPSTCRNTPAWPGILESPCRRRVPQGCSTARTTLPAQSPSVGLSEARPFYSCFSEFKGTQSPTCIGQPLCRRDPERQLCLLLPAVPSPSSAWAALAEEKACSPRAVGVCSRSLSLIGIPICLSSSLFMIYLESMYH